MLVETKVPSKHGLSKNIVRGLIVSFDIFDRGDIEKVNNRIKRRFGIEPAIQQSHTTIGAEPPESFTTQHPVWNISPNTETLEAFKDICNAKDFPCDIDLLKKFVKQFQIVGYDSPRLPFYTIVIRATLDEKALDASNDLRRDLFGVSVPLRLFADALEGLSKKTTHSTPSAPLITQMWVKTTKETLSEINEIAREIALLKGQTYDVARRMQELSKKIRELEPLKLADPVGDIHSYMLDGDNVGIFVGQVFQVALGGLRTPYLLQVSYEDELIPNEWIDAHSLAIESSLIRLDGIVMDGYRFLLVLISMQVYLDCISIEAANLDSQLSCLRESISKTKQNSSIEDLRHLLFELDGNGAKASSLASSLGTFSRRWENNLKKIVKGERSFVKEVSLGTGDLLQDMLTRGYSLEKGYLEIVTEQILQTLNKSRKVLQTEASEIDSLRTHLSDVVSLRASKANEDLQKSMKRLTQLSIVIALIAILISASLSTYSVYLSTLDFQKTHPEGTYYVTLDYLGYDSLTDTDHFRITINYQGRGVSEFLRLSIGTIGANATVVSKGNVEVMEPNVILAQNYVDGLIGWVDYDVYRPASMNRTRIDIIDYRSDVNTVVVDHTY